MNDVAVFWWVLSALAVAFVLVDWKHAPIDATMHIGFVLIVAFMGPLGLLLYVLTVREPLPHTHAQYIAPLWKQVVGSTFHCVAGDSVGIVGAALITSYLRVPMLPGLLIEYGAGFSVGWLIFQALFMKNMVGGSYKKALASMFMPEWLSMNGVMAGMALVMVVWVKWQPTAGIPNHVRFWFMMSMALIAGAIIAYPINWWLVSHGRKHGLMSTAKEADHEDLAQAQKARVRAPDNGRPLAPPGRIIAMHHHDPSVTRVVPYAPAIVMWSIGLLAATFLVALWLGYGI